MRNPFALLAAASRGPHEQHQQRSTLGRWLTALGARRRRAVWEAIAEEAGGRYYPGHVDGHWSERVELERGPVSVVLCTVREGLRVHVACVARFAAGAGPAFRIGRARVTTSEHAATRALWTRPALGAMRTYFARSVMVSDGRKLDLSVPGISRDREMLRAAVELVAEVAARDVYGAAALRAAGGAGYELPATGAPRAVIDAGARVVVGPDVAGDALVTVARLNDGARLRRLSLEVDAGGRGRGDDAARHVAELPQGARHHLADAGAGRLEVGDGEGMFAWREVVRDPARLRAGAGVLGALAASVAGGVFR